MVEGIAELVHNSLLSSFQISVQKYDHRKLRKMLPCTEEKSTHYSTNSIHAYFFSDFQRINNKMYTDKNLIT